MKKIQILVLALLCCGFSYGAAPTWSVNPSDYNFDMTVTAVLDVNCTELTNPSNQLGAFVGNENRGNVLSSTVVGGRYIALLSVYSNQASDEEITFKIYNAETDEILDAKTTLLFQDDAVYGTPTVPLSVQTNNPPTELSLSSLSIKENNTIGDKLGDLLVSDLDGSVGYTYSLVEGIGANNNTDFSIAASEVITNGVLDYEAKTSYKIRLRAEDGLGCSIEDTFAIEILNENDNPTNILLTNNFIDENAPKSEEIGQFATEDQDLTQTHAYSFVSGNGDEDNTSFAIQGNKLVTNSILDFETQSSYSIRVKSTDSQGGEFEKAFAILINDINDAPNGLLISTDSVFENNKMGQTIGDLTAVDQDNGDSHTFAFKDVPGNHNELFIIVGDQLKASTIFDYEELNEFFIYVSTIDSRGDEYFRLITVNIKDANDDPTSIILSNSSISESQPVGTYIGNLNTTDPDEGQVHLYELVNGVGDADNSSFKIKDDSLFSNEVFNVTVKNQYTIRLQVDDQNGGVYSEQVDVFVKDVNNEPTEIYLDNYLVLEDAKIGTTVGSFSAIDPDLGDGHSFGLVSGTGSDDNTSFVINGSDLITKTTFDFETKSIYKIRVEAKDNFGGTFQKEFVIEISNGNDLPSSLALSYDSVYENMNQGTVIGDFSTVDTDVDDTHIYTLTSSDKNDNQFFVINGNQLITAQQFDYEAKNLYFISVTTDDQNGGTLEKQFTVVIKDTTDSPTDIILTNNLIGEELPEKTLVGVFSSLDVDAGNTFQYQFIDGVGADDNASFVISNDTLRSNAVFDYTSTKTLKIRVKSTDNTGLSIEKSFVVNVTDENDTPTDIIITNTNVYENNGLGEVIGTFSSIDQDPADTHQYSLVAGDGDDDNSAFIISTNELKTNNVFDYELKDTLFIRVRSNDIAGASIDKTFEILISNGNDTPTDISLDTNVVYENLPQSSTITKITTTDQDVSNSHIYSFDDIAGNDNDDFVIFGDELRTNAVFDFETKSQYFVALRSTDPFGQSVTRQFTISVKDTSDTPVGIAFSDTTIFEKEDVGKLVGFLTTSDPDAGDTHTYSLVEGKGGENNTSFSIDGSSILSTVSFDYGEQAVYKVLIQTKDKDGLTFNQAFQIRVKNVNVAPTGVLISTSEINESSTIGTVVGEFSAIDEDENEAFTFKLVQGDGAKDNSRFVVENDSLITNSNLDFEKQSEYNIRIQVTDIANNTYEEALIITVIDANEAPVAIDEELFVNESAEAGTLLGTIAGLDEDKDQLLSYTLLTTEEEVPFSIDLLTGDVLLVRSSLNYETTSVYDLQVLVADDGDPVLIDTLLLTINVEDEIEGFLPSVNYVSPNGDGMNDYWTIDNVELYEDYKVIIFNGNGNVIYSVDYGYDNTWDGTFNGSDLPVGAYYYVVENNNGGQVFKGTISLVR